MGVGTMSSFFDCPSLVRSKCVMLLMKSSSAFEVPMTVFPSEGWL